MARRGTQSSLKVHLRGKGVHGPQGMLHLRVSLAEVQAKAASPQAGHGRVVRRRVVVMIGEGSGIESRAGRQAAQRGACLCRLVGRGIVVGVGVGFVSPSTRLVAHAWVGGGVDLGHHS